MSTRLTASLLLATLTLSLPALAEDDQPQRTPVDAAPIAERAPVNAALRYWPQWYLLESEFAKRPSADFAKAFTGDTSDSAIAAEALVNENPRIVTGLIEASFLPTVSWGIDWERGPYTNIYHLRPLRSSSHVLLADARRCLRDADDAAAAERFTAALRMARHAKAGNEFLMSSLICISVFEATAREIEAALDADALDVEAQHTIAGALNAFNGDDPFSARAGIRREGVDFAAWLRVESASNDPDRRAELVGFFVDNAAANPEAMTTIRTMLERNDPLDPLFWLFEKVYKEADAAWVAPNADEALRALAARVANGEFGPLAEVLLPSLERVKTSDTRAQSTLSALRARLAQS